MNDYSSLARTPRFPSLNLPLKENIFIPFLTNLNISTSCWVAGIVKNPLEVSNGGCSSVAERATVARITGVRFSPSALYKEKMVKKVNILFVCRYNRFRSRVALAYFNKINKNKNIKAKSAGLIRGMPLNPKTVSIARKLGFNISGKPKGLSSKLLAWQNLTVIVADDVPEQVFDRNKKYGKKVINWKIKDAEEYNIKEIKRLIRDITKKMDELNKQLERK